MKNTLGISVSLVTLLGVIYLFSAPAVGLYNIGFGDGFAVGYNDICHPGAVSSVHGDWGDAEYSQGYYEGNEEGKAACLGVEGSGD